MKKKNSHISFQNFKENKLSIQFNLDGFSFCITNSNTKQDVYFCEYTFEDTLKTPENLLEKIKEIFKNDTILQEDFSEVNVIHQNELSSIVPNAFFSEEKLTSYLNYNIKTFATDFIAFDEIAQISAKSVYIPYVNINNYLFQNFGDFNYQHHSTVLLEKYLNHNSAKEKVMYVNVSKNYLDIIVLQNNTLLLSNCFKFTTKEDFIYYILFVAEQLSLDNSKFSLYFTGQIALESELYKIAYQYIKNCYFLESKNEIFKHLDAANHNNYILLGL
ncbi:DUF3822 family protein [uncultured Polaribacter sp.]|uniref:DUF3822 family protein n=1 Tax=uncultured Polaribacter sp. TaxID=174711 RepID=UPI002632BBA3|nr:DUF3822 family protein [uncultured Polaribacter sp.]